MTAHELARKLLNGPNLLIVTPKVKEYATDDEYTDMMEPSAYIREVVTPDGTADAVLLSYTAWKKDAQAKP